MLLKLMMHFSSTYAQRCFVIKGIKLTAKPALNDVGIITNLLVDIFRIKEYIL